MVLRIISDYRIVIGIDTELSELKFCGVHRPRYMVPMPWVVSFKFLRVRHLMAWQWMPPLAWDPMGTGNRARRYGARWARKNR